MYLKSRILFILVTGWYIFLSEHWEWDSFVFGELRPPDIKTTYGRNMVDIIDIVAHGNSHITHHDIREILQAVAHKKSNVLD